MADGGIGRFADGRWENVRFCIWLIVRNSVDPFHLQLIFGQTFV